MSTLTLDRTAPATESTGQQEFAALIERQSPLLYRVAFALLRHPQDAEDAVQETLLKMVRTRSWRRAEDTTAFLARAVWRTGLTRLSARHRARAAEFSEIEDSIPSLSASPEHEALGAQRAHRIAALMDALPPDLRAPLVLTAIEELTSAQVALVLDLPAGTVRSRALRARQLLRERYVALYGRPR